MEKLLQIAQRKKNQLLGVQPNQELNALIITDEAHKKAKEAAALMGTSIDHSIVVDDIAMLEAAIKVEHLAAEEAKIQDAELQKADDGLA